MADLQTKVAAFLGSLVSGRPQVQAGPDATQQSIDMDGTITTGLTTTGTIADTNETTLFTNTLNAGVLDRNGRGVRVTAWGTLANTANTKTIKLYFGGTVIATYSAAGQNVPWYVEGIVLRTGASAQLYNVLIQVGVAPISVTPATTAIDTTAAIILKVTGTNGLAALNDIVLTGAVVELI